MTDNVYKQKHIKAHIEVAKAYSKLSHAKRLKVGAFLIRGDTPLAMGWNGRLPGEPNVCEDEHNNTLPDVRHAEINALNKLRRSSETAQGAIMIQTHSTCPQCALDVIDSKLLGIVFVTPYRDLSGIYKLIDKGMTVYQYNESMERFFEHRLVHPEVVQQILVPSDQPLTFKNWR